MKGSSAFSIAIKSLRSCYGQLGIYAGGTHFYDLWARDHCFSSWGALFIGDHVVVKKGLVSLLTSAKKGGQMCLRIGVSPIGQIIRFMGIPFRENNKVYCQDKGLSPPLDQNSLFLVTLEKYVRESGDVAFLKSHKKEIQEIFSWNISQEKQGLLWGGNYSSWQDSVKKPGWVASNNALYYGAVNSMYFFAQIWGDKKYLRFCFRKKKALKKRFWKVFGNDSEISDFHDGKKQCDIFSLDANLFALYFDLVPKEHESDILQKILELTQLTHPFGAMTNAKPYQWYHISLRLWVLGMGDYHNASLRWLWIGCLLAVVLCRRGKKKQAREQLTKISKIIEEHGKIFEVYEENGQPLKRLFYSSESPFAWSAGFFLWAYSELFPEEKNQIS
jgi:glycogen debranching enzyme